MPKIYNKTFLNAHDYDGFFQIMNGVYLTFFLFNKLITLNKSLTMLWNPFRIPFTIFHYKNALNVSLKGLVGFNPLLIILLINDLNFIGLCLQWHLGTN